MGLLPHGWFPKGAFQKRESFALARRMVVGDCTVLQQWTSPINNCIYDCEEKRKKKCLR